VNTRIAHLAPQQLSSSAATSQSHSALVINFVLVHCTPLRLLQAYQRNAISSVQAKIDAAAVEYRVAYGALSLLSSDSSQVSEFGWKKELLLLKDEDICDLSEGKAERLGKKQSEGRRTISWIWKMVSADDLEDDNFLRESMFICSSCFLNANINSKGFVLNGVNHEHAQVASQKK
jgi:hypothetical protein